MRLYWLSDLGLALLMRLSFDYRQPPATRMYYRMIQVAEGLGV